MNILTSEQMADRSNKKKLKKVSIGDIVQEREIIGNLAIPSTMHSYSMCVEFAKRWFLSRFKCFRDDYFKEDAIYIDGTYIFDNFRKFTMDDLLKRPKPSLAITPNIDLNFNRDMVDSSITGIDQYIKRSRLEGAFFKDRDRNLFLLCTMEAIQVSFNFKVRLSTVAQQIDIYKYMMKAFRVGYTEGVDMDLDFHVPYDLMLNLAKDAGFEVDKDRIVKVSEFIYYLNSHSELSFLYKFRGVNGRNEFFIRMKDQYIHTRISDIDRDSGERKGQLNTNFTIDMNTVVTFPSMQFYMYFSENRYSVVETTLSNNSLEALGIYSIRLTQVAPRNEKGWDLLVTTDIDEPDHSKLLEINLEPLFKDNFGEDDDILKVIKYNREHFINSAIFLDIKLYNYGYEVISFDMNWNTLDLKVNISLPHDITTMALYVDMNYLHTTLQSIEKQYESRMS